MTGRFPRSVSGVGAEPDPRASLANERTFLAWIRTALALAAGGVALEALDLPVAGGLRLSAAVLLTTLGAGTPVLAWFRWAAVERALRLRQPLPASLLGPVVAVGVSVSGLPGADRPGDGVTAPGRPVPALEAAAQAERTALAWQRTALGAAAGAVVAARLAAPSGGPVAAVLLAAGGAVGALLWRVARRRYRDATGALAAADGGGVPGPGLPAALLAGFVALVGLAGLLYVALG
ncbi:YidH family protein [Blastococcus sp. TF02A-26]|uniref:YidH family protein n=1 Tax=Blastococcus sp. TF02A-26 TaxID=2250577 RepID=UPI0018F4FC91|nr:DUF202 domain-containing protein [Blastococcus sp. TF02A-26]